MKNRTNHDNYNTSLRIPRPAGTTQAIKQYKATKDRELLESIQRRLISDWIMTNGYFSGKRLSNIELSKFLCCDQSLISQIITQNFLSSKIWDAEKSKELLNSVVGQSIMWAVEDRMDASEQLNNLLASQGSSYKPYVTTEVNSAIRNKQSTTKGLLEVTRSISGGSTVNIFNKVEQQNTQQQIKQEIFNVERAVEVLENNSDKLLNITQAQKVIEQHYDHSSWPDVKANAESEQVPTLIKPIDETSATRNYAKNKHYITSEDHHEIRREIADEIDEDSDDPEVLIY
jgi:hypothetical protein